MTDNDAETRADHAREAKLRRQAQREGFILTKSRTAPYAYNPDSRYFIATEENWLLSTEWGMTLDEVEAWLTTDE